MGADFVMLPDDLAHENDIAKLRDALAASEAARADLTTQLGILRLQCELFRTEVPPIVARELRTLHAALDDARCDMLTMEDRHERQVHELELEIDLLGIQLAAARSPKPLSPVNLSAMLAEHRRVTADQLQLPFGSDRQTTHESF